MTAGPPAGARRVQVSVAFLEALWWKVSSQAQATSSLILCLSWRVGGSGGRVSCWCDGFEETGSFVMHACS